SDVCSSDLDQHPVSNEVQADFFARPFLEYGQDRIEIEGFGIHALQPDQNISLANIGFQRRRRVDQIPDDKLIEIHPIGEEDHTASIHREGALLVPVGLEVELISEKVEVHGKAAEQLIAENTVTKAG